MWVNGRSRKNEKKFYNFFVFFLLLLNENNKGSKSATVVWLKKEEKKKRNPLKEEKTFLWVKAKKEQTEKTSMCSIVANSMWVAACLSTIVYCHFRAFVE